MNKTNTATTDSTAVTTTPAGTVTEQQTQQRTVGSEYDGDDLDSEKPYIIKGGDTLWDIAKKQLKKQFNKNATNYQIL